MKKFFYVLAAAPFILGFAACNGDDTGRVTGDDIVVVNTEALTQTVYADKTSCTPLQFTAKGDWAVTENETTKANIAWLTVNPVSGKSGDHTMTFTLARNTSGADRSAELFITCGQSQAKIAITQKATTESGEEVKLKQISEIYQVSSVSSREYTKMKFTYDDAGAITALTAEIANIEEDEDMDNSTVQTVNGDFKVTYPAGKAVFDGTFTSTLYNNLVINIIYEAMLNSYNYTTRFNCDYKEYMNGSLTDSESFSVDLTYDSGNRIVKGIDTDGYTTTVTWSDNTITGSFLYDKEDESERAEYTYTDIANNQPFDLCWMFGFGDSESMLTLCVDFAPLGLMDFIGTRSQYLVESAKISYDSVSDVITYKYTLDSEGYVTKVETRENNELLYITTITYKTDK